MPLCQKSKFHARKKHIHNHSNSESHKSVQAAAVVEEQPASCSSSVLEGNPQSPSATETSSASPWSGGTSSITTTSSSAVETRSDKSDKSQHEQRKCSYSSEDSAPKNSWSDILPTKVELLEQFILKKHKQNRPILMKDMLKLVGEDYQDQFADVLKKASERIEVVFAVDVEEVDSSNHSYALVSKLALPFDDDVYARRLLKTGLLINILCLIFMNGSRATEEEVWKFLSKMEVYAGKKHFIYGEPRRIIMEDFLDLEYLEYRLVPNSNPAYYEFVWGPQAYTEESEKLVIEFLTKVGDKVPSVFLPWYEEDLQDEEPAQAPDTNRPGTGAPVSQGSVAPASRASLKAEDHLIKTKK